MQQIFSGGCGGFAFPLQSGVSSMIRASVPYLSMQLCVVGKHSPPRVLHFASVLPNFPLSLPKTYPNTKSTKRTRIAIIIVFNGNPWPFLCGKNQISLGNSLVLPDIANALLLRQCTAFAIECMLMTVFRGSRFLLVQDL